jgi:hypothetical protein
MLTTETGDAVSRYTKLYRSMGGPGLMPILQHATDREE